MAIANRNAPLLRHFRKRRLFFDENKVVIDDTLSLADGALCGWDASHPYYHSLFKSLAKHYGFSITTPYKNLSEKYQNILLHGGDPDDIITFTFYTQRQKIKHTPNTQEPKMSLI